MIDTHCHLQHPQYDPDRDELIERTLAAGCAMVCVGNDWKTSKGAIELAGRYNKIWATVGSHPTEDDGHPIDDFRKLIKDGEKIIAVGEVGLDYYRTPETEKRAKQKEMFLQHLELAKESKLPLVIHCRDPLRRSSSEASAYEDMIGIIQTHPFEGAVHSFNGTWEQAKRFLDLGLYIGLNGIVTFSHNYDEMVRQIPLERLLLETDAPYLAPPPHRGQRNEPLYVKFVAEHIAKLRSMDVNDLTHTTTNNAMKLFNFYG